MISTNDSVLVDQIYISCTLCLETVTEQNVPLTSVASVPY